MNTVVQSPESAASVGTAADKILDATNTSEANSSSSSVKKDAAPPAAAAAAATGGRRRRFSFYLMTTPTNESHRKSIDDSAPSSPLATAFSWIPRSMTKVSDGIKRTSSRISGGGGMVGNSWFGTSKTQSANATVSPALARAYEVYRLVKRGELLRLEPKDIDAMINELAVGGGGDASGVDFDRPPSESGGIFERIALRRLTFDRYFARTLARLFEYRPAGKNAAPAAVVRHLSVVESAMGAEACTTLAAALHGHPFLEELDLSRNVFGSSGAQALAGAVASPMPRLRIINVADCGVGTSGMAALASALAKADTPSLESIVLDGNTVMDSKNAAMDALRDVLTSQPTLATLSLARTNLGHRGCVALAAHLRLNSSLRKLSLDLAGLGDSAGAADDDESAAAALGSAIAAHGQLTHLQLSRNNLGDAGVCAFANAMLSGVAGKTIALKHLGLAMNNISADGARALGSLLRAIAVNSSAAAAGSLDGLATLDLSDNRVDDAGFAHLVDAVAIEGGTLVNLVLQGNMIGDSGITQLIEQAIVPDDTLSAVDAKRPLSLKYVNLAGNPQITAAGYDALTTALEKNTTIKGVHLDFNLATGRPRQPNAEVTALQVVASASHSDAATPSAANGTDITVQATAAAATATTSSWDSWYDRAQRTAVRNHSLETLRVAFARAIISSFAANEEPSEEQHTAAAAKAKLPLHVINAAFDVVRAALPDHAATVNGLAQVLSGWVDPPQLTEAQLFPEDEASVAIVEEDMPQKKQQQRARSGSNAKVRGYHVAMPYGLLDFFDLI